MIKYQIKYYLHIIYSVLLSLYISLMFFHCLEKLKALEHGWLRRAVCRKNSKVRRSKTQAFEQQLLKDRAVFLFSIIHEDEGREKRLPVARHDEPVLGTQFLLAVGHNWRRAWYLLVLQSAGAQSQVQQLVLARAGGPRLPFCVNVGRQFVKPPRGDRRNTLYRKYFNNERERERKPNHAEVSSFTDI